MNNPAKHFAHDEREYWEWAELEADGPSSTEHCEAMTARGVRRVLVAVAAHRCSRCRGCIEPGMIFTRELLPECVLCLPVCPLPIRPRLAVAAHVRRREALKEAGA